MFDHGNMELFGWEGTSKPIQFQSQGQGRLPPSQGCYSKTIPRIQRQPQLFWEFCSRIPSRCLTFPPPRAMGWLSFPRNFFPEGTALLPPSACSLPAGFGSLFSQIFGVLLFPGLVPLSAAGTFLASGFSRVFGLFASTPGAWGAEGSFSAGSPWGLWMISAARTSAPGTGKNRDFFSFGNSLGIEKESGGGRWVFLGFTSRYPD